MQFDETKPTNLQDFVDFFNDRQTSGKARKGGKFKTGVRSKAPRNIASRKLVKR